MAQLPFFKHSYDLIVLGCLFVLCLFVLIDGSNSQLLSKNDRQLEYLDLTTDSFVSKIAFERIEATSDSLHCLAIEELCKRKLFMDSYVLPEGDYSGTMLYMDSILSTNQCNNMKNEVGGLYGRKCCAKNETWYERVDGMNAVRLNQEEREQGMIQMLLNK